MLSVVTPSSANWYNNEPIKASPAPVVSIALTFSAGALALTLLVYASAPSEPLV
mgnify:CR=1 FL=1